MTEVICAVLGAKEEEEEEEEEEGYENDDDDADAVVVTVGNSAFISSSTASSTTSSCAPNCRATFCTSASINKSLNSGAWRRRPFDTRNSFLTAHFRRCVSAGTSLVSHMRAVASRVVMAMSERG